MPHIDAHNAVSVLQIHQLVADWCEDLDRNNCSGIQNFCTEDVEYLVGGVAHRGRDAVAAFYAARNERVAKHQRDGVRTQRHSVSNFRVAFRDADNASITFLLVNYSAEGPAPALNLVGPTIIADSRFDVRRTADGEWRIALFDSKPTFIGNDPFLNAAVVPK
ncbi:nuclear transport factor 2 family protein [Sphingobium sufflavum]|uniref:nuclear transport factor 2 family protein n=1 Tax=Sphingobium sufflavum TaxID=1129547 RepID=UPI001F489D38|nr:nuclear transport factor 2 family protein [Sphingobium sufflavum]MCE7795214.1 nuclear transport factor 2 family protein [Sphingobium sufflavum]